MEDDNIKTLYGIVIEILVCILVPILTPKNALGTVGPFEL